MLRDKELKGEKFITYLMKRFNYTKSGAEKELKRLNKLKGGAIC